MTRTKKRRNIKKTIVKYIDASSSKKTKKEVSESSSSSELDMSIGASGLDTSKYEEQMRVLDEEY